MLVYQSVTSHPPGQVVFFRAAQPHATRLENVWTSSCPWTIGAGYIRESHLPSGKLSHNYGKIPIFHGKIHYFYGHVQ